MSGFTEVNNKSKEIHFRYGVFDAHCDTVHLFKAGDHGYEFSSLNTSAQVDLPRLKSGGVKVQCYALFIEPEHKPCGALKRCMQLVGDFYEVAGANSEIIEPAFTGKEAAQINEKDKIAAFITVEGGEALEGDAGLLKVLHRLGIRSVGLTWNQRNQLADGISERNAGGGLTRLGKEVIKEMNRLGMMVDLAHMTPAGFKESLEVSESPLIVSHANAHAICEHPRNLSDEQLKMLRENGGVVGMTFYPPFIDRENPCLDRVLDHLEHVAEVSGIDHVGLGSDFDGMKGRFLEDLKDPSFLPRLTQGLLNRGFKEEEVGKVLYGNFFRIVSSVCNKNN